MFNNPMMSYPMQSMERYSVGMNWVNGMQDVDSAELPPGSNAVFFDKTNDGMMYIKTRDRFNVYSTRIFKIEEIIPKMPENRDYVTRTELEEMFQKFLGGMTQNDSLRTDDGSTDPTEYTTDSTATATTAHPEARPASGSKRKTDGSVNTGVKRS